MTSLTGPAAATIERVRQTFDSGRTRDVEWRREQLKGVVSLLEDHEADLLAALDADLGKPATDAWLTDLAPTRLEAKHALTHVEQWMRPTSVKVPVFAKPGRAWTQAEPKGVALIIGAWNYPVQLTVAPLIAALAAGNAVVLKPSELAPATSELLAKLVPGRLDPDAVAVVEGGVDETTELLRHPFDHIFFTGSTRVGRIVMEAAARHLTPVTLELGGKSPTIIAADADIGVAARRVAWAKIVNAGQTCIAPDYVLVERAVRDQFTDALTTELSKFRDTAPSTQIVNDTHVRRLEGLLADHGGTEVLVGRVDHTARTVDPVVIADPNLDAPLMQEEIFGPLLPVVTVDSVDDATAFVRSRPKPLALYLFTSSPATEENVLAHTSSGGVCVNHAMYHVVVPDLPFGGVGASGMGAYHGEAGFETFSHRRSVLRRSTRADVSLAYPPYGRVARRLLRTLFR